MTEDIKGCELEVGTQGLQHKGCGTDADMKRMSSIRLSSQLIAFADETMSLADELKIVHDPTTLCLKVVEVIPQCITSIP